VNTCFETDWLGSVPCFYHEKTGKFSTCIHDVIDYRNLEFDPDGLNDYLDLGYCGYGWTPVRHVRFLPPCSRLMRDKEGGLHEQPLPDPVDEWDGRTSTPDEAIDRLRATVHAWENSVADDIVLPLSGGYDSRLLAMLLRDKSRVRAFTYGVSPRQEKSREVYQARAAAATMNLRWERIELGDFHSRIGAWEAQFGVSTHAHGMYHMEFYDKIRAIVGSGRPMLSGLVGDLWAGSVAYRAARSVDDLPALGLSRSLHAQGSPCRLHGDGDHRRTFWTMRRHRLQDPVFQVVEVVRQKMILLSYLLSVPARSGFQPWSPFLLPDVALAMVTLPVSERRGRLWQQRVFTENGLNLERSPGGTRANFLDLGALDRRPPEPLAIDPLSELFEVSFLEQVNRRVFSSGTLAKWWAAANAHPRVVGAATRLRLGNPRASAYAAYLTLKPLQMLIERRNRA
jgi:hypothetical protein